MNEQPEYQLNGICEDPEHEVCFTLAEWEKYYKPELAWRDRVKEVANKLQKEYDEKYTCEDTIVDMWTLLEEIGLEE
jgi:hypothetical protein